MPAASPGCLHWLDDEETGRRARRDRLDRPPGGRRRRGARRAPALRARLALANKESLVAAGELALSALERGGGLLVPVDSEHSAAFQCLEGRAPESVDSLVLTASGGPFRGRTREDLADVTP